MNTDKNTPTCYDDDMEHIKKHGEKIIVVDNQIELTCYLYNDRLYIDDAKRVH